MFIQTETTPNPATLKFIPGRPVMGDGTLDMRGLDEAVSSPLAQALFAIEGVGGVFYGSDFLSVTKSAGEWQHLKPAILGAIMEHYLSGAPLFEGATAPAFDLSGEEFFAPEDAEIVTVIKDLLETRVRPAVAGDGGDITFKGFRSGTVYLSMKGACAGCPSSTATLRNGIENLFRHFLPEVVGVEAV
jgi:Fe-S cluster biogenesis protein NfuA